MLSCLDCRSLMCVYCMFLSSIGESMYDVPFPQLVNGITNFDYLTTLTESSRAEMTLVFSDSVADSSF